MSKIQRKFNTQVAIELSSYNSKVDWYIYFLSIPSEQIRLWLLSNGIFNTISLNHVLTLDTVNFLLHINNGWHTTKNSITRFKMDKIDSKIDLFDYIW